MFESSELVGLNVDCIQQYLPHRVAMQFGMNQDVPGDGQEPMKLLKSLGNFIEDRLRMLDCIFHLDRFSEPYVAARYLEWQNKKSEGCSLQSLFGGGDEPVNLAIEDELRNEGSQESLGGLGNYEVDTLGLDLQARIKKLEEVFA